MSSDLDLNLLYKNVRELGYPYQIKETGGSIIIQISASNQSKSIHHSRKKFRFHTSRTLNGSDTQNWRNPQTFTDASLSNRSDFPDIAFFRRTPPPPHARPPPPPSVLITPPPPALACALATSTTAVSPSPQANQLISKSESLESPQGSNSSRTPPNPYRWSRRKIIFPLTPNLLFNPISAPISSPSESQASAVSTTIAMDSTSEDSSPDYEELTKVMKAIYEMNHF